MNTSTSTLSKHYQTADKTMLMILAGLFIYSLCLAPWYSTWAPALVIGGLTLAASFAIYQLQPGTTISRAMLGAAFMVMSGLHIQQAHGMIEFHFGVFVLLAVLLYYRDWIPLVVAAGTIAVHHIAFYYFQSQGSDIWVLDTINRGWSVIFLHAAYVVIETIILLVLANNLKMDAHQSAEVMDTINNMLSDGNINLQVTTSGESELSKRLNALINEVGALARSVIESADALTAEGQNLTKLTKTMNDAVEQQRHEAQLITDAVGQISTASHEVSENADQAAHAAREVDHSSNESTNVSQQTQQRIKQLSAEIESATATIEQLDKRTGDIGQVLDVIRSVADQTNLLALNAAIEAARAGEQGRGFAVVADEVRTLAQRTQASTEEIDQMIAGLRNDSSRAVRAISTSKDNAELCVASTNESMELLRKTSEAIQAIYKMNDAMACAATEQTAIVSDLLKNLSKVTAASDNMAQESTKTQVESRQLEQIAQKLQQVTHRFKI